MIRSVGYDEAADLVSALAAELTIRYGGGPASMAQAGEFVPPFGVFLVVSEDGQDLACGGVRLIAEGIGEIKRMYVVPHARGRGLARRLLRELVAHAENRGLDELWLETGTAQPEAMALYESEGFQAIAPYGQYKDEPESRCYRLVLSPSQDQRGTLSPGGTAGGLSG